MVWSNKAEKGHRNQWTQYWQKKATENLTLTFKVLSSILSYADSRFYPAVITILFMLLYTWVLRFIAVEINVKKDLYSSKFRERLFDPCRNIAQPPEKHWQLYAKRQKKVALNLFTCCSKAAFSWWKLALENFLSKIEWYYAGWSYKVGSWFYSRVNHQHAFRNLILAQPHPAGIMTMLVFLPGVTTFVIFFGRKVVRI